MQAMSGLLILFATVLCIVPAALTFVEVQRVRKKLNETEVSTQSSLVMTIRRSTFSLYPTTESE
jgi:hypothetical protein